MKFILVFLVLFTSCVTTQNSNQKLNPNIYYRHDLCFTYETGKEVEQKIRGFFRRFRNGKYRKTKLVPETVTFCGTGVLPYMEEYRITIKSHEHMKLFTVKSCHEEATTENKNKTIFRSAQKEVTIKYTPTIERGEACPLYIATYNRKTKYNTGLIVFEHPEYQLDATLFCNGYETQQHGVSICHSRKSLVQKLEFSEPVLVGDPVKGPAERKEDDPCPPMVLSADKKSTTLFKLPARECVYPFIGTISGKKHQFYTSGYEGIILRE
jgi:hypothetical protein